MAVIVVLLSASPALAQTPAVDIDQAELASIDLVSQWASHLYVMGAVNLGVAAMLGVICGAIVAVDDPSDDGPGLFAAIVLYSGVPIAGLLALIFFPTAIILDVESGSRRGARDRRLSVRVGAGALALERRF